MRGGFYSQVTNALSPRNSLCYCNLKTWYNLKRFVHPHWPRTDFYTQILSPTHIPIHFHFLSSSSLPIAIPSPLTAHHRPAQTPPPWLTQFHLHPAAERWHMLHRYVIDHISRELGRRVSLVLAYAIGIFDSWRYCRCHASPDSEFGLVEYWLHGSCWWLRGLIGRHMGWKDLPECTKRWSGYGNGGCELMEKTRCARTRKRAARDVSVPMDRRKGTPAVTMSERSCPFWVFAVCTKTQSINPASSRKGRCAAIAWQGYLSAQNRVFGTLSSCKHLHVHPCKYRNHGVLSGQAVGTTGLIAKLNALYCRWLQDGKCSLWRSNHAKHCAVHKLHD